MPGILLRGDILSANDCTANFDYYPSSTGPLDIQFINLSTGPIGWYTWDFGDGFQSNEPDPLHSYQQPGTYWVCLTVSSPVKDCYDVKCLQIIVPIPTNCYTPFISEPSGSNPFFYTFTAYPGPDVDTLIWDFGEGNLAGGLVQTHSYTDTGTFVVSLTAFNHLNPTGCYSLITDTIHITVQPCISAFIMDAPSYNPLKVHFIPVANGDINNYYWQFGDGKTSFEVSPIHTYTDTGTYQVCLTVSNSLWPAFCTDTSCQWIKIKPERCKADFSWEQNSVYPLKFSFTNLSTGILNSFFWDFGDGDTSDAIEPIHNFPEPGSYTVKLKVKNKNYPEVCSDSTQKIINIPSLACTAEFTFTTDSLWPVDVSFVSAITGTPDVVQWDFGDGSTSTELNPIHSFPDTGTYLVTLSVFNTAYQNFCADTTSQVVHLKIKHKPRADFSFYLDSLALQPNLFYFKDLSLGHKITQWYWTFGDGGNSKEQNPSHAYASGQNYQVCLKVYDFLPPKFLITDRTCKTLKGRNYFNLGGSVFAGDYPINNPIHQNDTALVGLFRIYPGPLIRPVRSGKFVKLGYYWFSDVLEGEYLVKASLSPGSRHYLEYFPTWATQALVWQAADPITLNKNIFDANIFLKKKNHIGSGPGYASGRVVLQQDYSGLQLIPASQALVFLKNSNGVFLDYTISDTLGQFSFEQLPLATYIFESESPGLICRADTAFLTISEPLKKDLLIKLLAQHSLSSPEPEPDNQLVIYPNPSESELFLRWFSPAFQNVDLSVISIEGKPLIQTTQSAQAGENYWKINLHSLATGVYFLKICSPMQGITFKRFIKH
ncbi:MAG: PKD domain-containing protein [Bacteroidales bacterium]